MQVLSSQEINHVSGAFSAVKVLDKASEGALFAALIGVYFGAGMSALSCLLRGAAIFGGVTLAYEAAQYFDEHYATPAQR